MAEKYSIVYKYHNTFIHSSADGHLGCFQCPSYYEQCCIEHRGTCVSFNSGFLGVYAQQWDCWVIWQFLEKAMATHSSTLAWKIPQTEEPGGLQSVEVRSTGHDEAQRGMGFPGGTSGEEPTCTLFTIARTQKQPRCPLADERIKKLWHITAMEYYSAI